MIQKDVPAQEYSGCRTGAYAAQLASRNQELREEIKRRKEIEAQLRQAQKDLKRARDRYMDLFELSPVGYVGLNEKGHMRDINLTAARLLGICRADLIAQPFTNCLGAEYRPAFQTFLADCFRDRTRHACTVRLNGSGETTHHESQQNPASPPEANSETEASTDLFSCSKIVSIACAVTPDLEHGGLLCRLALIDLTGADDLPPMIRGPVTL
jgi:PAS domain S-box-containing protein